MENVTANIVVRHSAKYPHKADPEYRKCHCRKSLWAYDGVYRNKAGRLAYRYISCGTRTWSRAEDKLQEYLDGFDPVKQELKKLRAEKEASEIRIEDAVALFYGGQDCHTG